MCYNNSMSDAIIVAIITGLVSLVANLLANYSARKKDAIANAIRDQKIEDKLQALSDRVDEHNGMLDKITNIEKSIVRIETKIEGK